MDRAKAWQLLCKHMKNQNLIRHCLAVEAVMRALAGHFKESEDLWGIVGLLHDGDYEETKNDASKHTLKMVEWLKEEGVDNKDIIKAILSHNYAHTGQNMPQNNLEWSLYCCDELTGLIVAVVLVKGKKLENVTVESVLKKFPEKNFAAGVHRQQIEQCEEKLDIKLADFISLSLEAMKKIAGHLSL